MSRGFLILILGPRGCCGCGGGGRLPPTLLLSSISIIALERIPLGGFEDTDDADELLRDLLE